MMLPRNCIIKSNSILKREYLENDPQSYQEIYDNFELKDLRDFVVDKLVKNTRRVTIELFANKITDKEKNYKLLDAYSLDGGNYELIGLEELSLLKFNKI